MKTIWLISDHHFGHKNILTFKDDAGELIRPGFQSAEEMDEHMVDRWNSVVKPEDHVYHLGDVAISKKHIATVGRCNGHKRLVRGNHDIFDTQDYLKYFDQIYGVRVLEGFIFSHIPLHPDCLRDNWINVHGHLHAKKSHPGRYFNCSVEPLNYTPISLEELKSRFSTSPESSTTSIPSAQPVEAESSSQSPR